MAADGGNRRWRARFAADSADLAACQRLRHLAFVERAGASGRSDGRDADDYDPLCAHLMVEDAHDSMLVACCRLMVLASGAGIAGSYSAQFYGLEDLVAYPAPMIELGRFCLHPARHEADILRLMWAQIAALVDQQGAGLLFGCSSFAGTGAETHRDAFGLLRQHPAPSGFLPRVKAPEVIRFADAGPADTRRGLAGLPPLLRSYLTMGGWVGDHAVVDRRMNTLHVFTGVEIGKVPKARARSIRAVGVHADGALG